MAHRKLIHCLAGLTFLFLMGCSSVGSLSRPDEKIRASILKQTPLGCSSAQVYEVIKQQHWTIHYESTKNGFIKHGEDKLSAIEVGNSSVACELGSTFLEDFPFKTVVIANWGFDKNNHLIEVWIDKQTNDF